MSIKQTVPISSHKNNAFALKSTQNETNDNLVAMSVETNVSRETYEELYKSVLILAAYGASDKTLVQMICSKGQLTEDRAKKVLDLITTQFLKGDK